MECLIVWTEKLELAGLSGEEASLDSQSFFSLSFLAWVFEEKRWELISHLSVLFCSEFQLRRIRNSCGMFPYCSCVFCIPCYHVRYFSDHRILLVGMSANFCFYSNDVCFKIATIQRFLLNLKESYWREGGNTT